MANKEIGNLPAATTPLDGTELLHLISGANSRKTTTRDVLKQTMPAADQAAARASISAALAGHINGLALSTNSGDTTNDIDIVAGEAASSQASPILMVYAGATGRQIDVAYGTGSGARFDSGISDGIWFVFLISNGTTTAVGMSKSADPTGQANYPSGYSHYRTLGYVERVSSTNRVPVMYADPTVRIAGAAPVFGCRAWVNFNGTTGAIRSSGNVASVTRVSAGNYTVNFAVPMPDADYSVVVSGSSRSGSESAHFTGVEYTSVPSVSAVRIFSANITGATEDFAYMQVAIFR